MVQLLHKVRAAEGSIFYLMNYDQLASQALQNGNQRQTTYDNYAKQYTNEYNQNKANANQAQQSLADYSKNMQSGTDFYNQGLAKGQEFTGYDPTRLAQSQNQVSQLTGVIGGLPRAIQASNANYGATAGNVANQLSTTGANLNQSLQLANQNAQNQMGLQSNALTAAQGFAQAGVQGQQNKVTALTNTAQNAATLLDQSRQAMAFWTDTAQKQGGLTAEQVQMYQNSKQLAAQAQASLASAGLLISQTKAQNLQNQQTMSAMEAAKAQKAAQNSQANTNATQDIRVLNGDTVAADNAKRAANGQTGLLGMINTAGYNAGQGFNSFLNWVSGGNWGY